MKCPFKLPLMDSSVPKLIFEADDAGAIIVAGEAKKAYAVRAINNHAALVDALHNLLSEAGKELAHAPDGDGDCPVCKALAAASVLLAELEQPNV